ncbi:DUF262 domain-containing protein [Corallococcus exiguus]|uniref:DUF262 domain-containing protein n=1 Tax=Corallococcus exiguus TaxID=83462 RepID=UPI001A8C9361|nr:DUF262 domain-containing protein [Corallococcus exiguus]MBN8471905.1 DUF262 domain-containing protein [Corallococcus exiguus]
MKKKGAAGKKAGGQAAHEAEDVGLSVFPVSENSVILTYLRRAEIEVDPEYQREGRVWSKESKQSLIDSLINGYDVPKLYLHEHLQSKVKNGKKYKYSLIDGRQRLEAIWGFIENRFPLAERFEYLNDGDVDLAGLTYEELAERYPLIKAYFDGRPLALMAVRTSDTELIEDMFSRLNEAAPLNAPEKRNALGGPFPKAIRSLVSESFFEDKLPFSNRRYRHLDLACKFMLLAESGVPSDTKKIDLDEFVRAAKQSNDGERRAKSLSQKVKSVLLVMSKVFIDDDPLLRNVGMVVVYFLIFMHALENRKTSLLRRQRFLDFDALRRENRVNAEKGDVEVDFELIRFDEVANQVNDRSAMVTRCNTIIKHARLGLPVFSKIVTS